MASHQSAPPDREMHKSMIDDVERPGAEAHGRFESNPDEKEGHYDPEEAAANKDKKDTTQTNQSGASTQPAGSTTQTNPAQSGSNDASAATTNTGTSSDTDRRPAGGVGTGGVANTQSIGQIQQGQNSNPMSNSNEPNQGFGGAGAQPSVDAKPTASEPQHSGQGSGRPTEAPKDQQESGQEQHKSAAPKPLGAGGAGGAGKTMGGNGPALPEDNAEEEGTGEKYVKSTGVAAEGGDFDATKPGAAKEADRLMAQAGITHGEGKPEMPKDEKKAFAVDKSGFGGHGSHRNNPPKGSGDETASEKTHHEKAHNMPVPGSDTDKSWVEKIKEKVTHKHDSDSVDQKHSTS